MFQSIFPFYQAEWQANNVFTDINNTPSISELEELINEAQLAGFSVMIRPIMDEQAFLSSNMWRGEIKPKSPDA